MDTELLIELLVVFRVLNAHPFSIQLIAAEHIGNIVAGERGQGSKGEILKVPHKSQPDQIGLNRKRLSRIE